MRNITLVVILVLLGGCKIDSDVSDGLGSASIKEYSLSDGTKCAVLIGVYKGGITCDWSAGQ